MKKKVKFFFFGFGQTAKYFIKELVQSNKKFDFFATNTSKTRNLTFKRKKYTSFKFKDNKYDKNLIHALKESDYILISIPPQGNNDVVLEQFEKILKDQKFIKLIYLSATSVYGNHNGEWVDENSKCIPSSSNGIARLKVENCWLDLFKKFNYPIQIFRLSGIYSDKNNVLKRLKTGEAKLIFKENHFFSRIHVDDISNILFKSLKTFKSGEIFNISDDKPAPLSEVTLYGAKLLNIKKLKELKVEEIDSEMLKNFFKDSKKVQNKKMKKFFDYNLKYPSFTEGLDYIRNNFV